MSCLIKLVWSVSLNIFIVLGSARHNFCAVVGMISCYQNPIKLFSFISIHRVQLSPTILPKDKNPPWFAASEAEQ